jgi:hypothetical protein
MERWQLMHSETVGTAAVGDVAAYRWQNRQAIFNSPA